MRTKLVYRLRLRGSDGDTWGEPETFTTRKQRDTAASYARIIGGYRTYSYEERVPVQGDAA